MGSLHRFGVDLDKGNFDRLELTSRIKAKTLCNWNIPLLSMILLTLLIEMLGNVSAVCEQDEMGD